ncbi:uncharacterized protein [Ambystoma mexicanum]|uniref:uncharacterized protein n=1 Tax=Ambystoma mexicanum TaxID=8296 RepID=UPI0037E7F448
MPQLASDNVIDTFQQAVSRDLYNLNCKKHKNWITQNNLTKSERKALVSLKLDSRTVIKEADKGGNIVLMDREDYLEMASRHLNTPGCYELRTDDFRKSALEQVEAHILNWHRKGLITDDERTYLWIKEPVTPTMYFLPKIHKPYERIPEGRPIMSGIGWVTENISEYLDLLLKPRAMSLHSYLQDSTSLIRKLKNFTWQSTFLLATLDVKALYTSIQHKWAMIAVDYTFRHESASYYNHLNMIKEMLHLTFDLNVFTFDNKVYQQTKGVAMGTKYAPALANIFMGMLEDKAIYTESFFIEKIQFWTRYIDDVFCIVDSSIEEFHAFVDKLNLNFFDIQFTGECNKQRIHFLDLTIYLEDQTTRDYEKF